jgi:anti-sigma B factor antagonist
MHAARPTIVSLAGDVDIASRQELVRLFEAAGSEEPFVIVDLGRVTFIDSLAIDQLMRVHAHAAERGGAIALVATDENLVRILSIAGVTRVARVFESLAQARDHVAGLMP